MLVTADELSLINKRNSTVIHEFDTTDNQVFPGQNQSLGPQGQAQDQGLIAAKMGISLFLVKCDEWCRLAIDPVTQFR